MSIVRTALPLVLLTSVLTGCAGLQKTDWPICAATGGVGLGGVENFVELGHACSLKVGFENEVDWETEKTKRVSRPDARAGRGSGG